MTADATAAAAALPVHTGTFAALRYGGYRRLLLGTTLANGSARSRPSGQRRGPAWPSIASRRGG
jgi:hypothetical protein